MGGRLRAAAALVVILLVGILGGSALSQWRTRPVPAGPEAARPRPVGRVRVEVLNGGGRPGVAREATELLRDLGFDVVFFGNARVFDRDTSLVLDRLGTIDGARDVADALGIRNVRSEPDSNLYLDVSVVLGKDWVPVTPPAGVAVGTTHRAWWDPRGWFRR